MSAARLPLNSSAFMNNYAKHDIVAVADAVADAVAAATPWNCACTRLNDEQQLSANPIVGI